MGEWKYNVEDCFDEKGNFTFKRFDPYRLDRNDPDEVSFFHALFYEDDFCVSLRFSVEQFILSYLRSNSDKVAWDCDMSALIHYDTFSCNTKGNYDVRYGWR